MWALALALLLALGCQTAPVPPIQLPPEEPAPVPEPPDLTGMDRDEMLEAARAYITAARAAGAISSSGPLEDPPFWDTHPTTVLRWHRVAGESTDTRFQVEGRPQHFEWWTYVAQRAVDPPPSEAPGVLHHEVLEHWPGCTEYRGYLRDPPTPDPEDPDVWIPGLRSVPSNVMVRGACIDPPPERIPVPEPPAILALVAGVPLLAILHRRRSTHA